MASKIIVQFVSKKKKNRNCATQFSNLLFWSENLNSRCYVTTETFFFLQ